MLTFLKKQISSLKEWSLFTFTVLLFTFLMVTSLVVWVHMFFKSQEQPLAISMSERTILTIQTLHQAILHIPEDQQQDFIDSYIKSNHLITITESSPQDSYVAAPNSVFWNQFKSRIIKNTHNLQNIIFAQSVNDVEGIWVGFSFKDYHFWLSSQSTNIYSPQLLKNHIGSGVVILVFSIIGTWITIGSINRYIQPIISVTANMSRGKKPDMLPENKGPKEIKEINAVINHMIHELDQTENDRKVMLAGISHDLRTPISRINLEIEMTDMDQKIRDSINEDLDQMVYIIDQLMMFSTSMQLATNKMVNKNISPIITKLCKHQQKISDTMGEEFLFEVEKDLYSYIPHTNLSRILMNLIENARKYGHLPDADNFIQVWAYKQDDQIIIDVSDNGPGITEEEKKRVMRPFSRGNQARTGVQGAGLGLAIIERLLKPYKGRIHLISKKDEGLTCRVVLPFIFENKSPVSDKEI